MGRQFNKKHAATSLECKKSKRGLFALQVPLKVANLRVFKRKPELGLDQKLDVTVQKKNQIDSEQQSVLGLALRVFVVPQSPDFFFLRS